MRRGDLERIAQDVRENNTGNYDKQDWTSSQVVILLENAPTIDPVQAAGGCYCRECRYAQYPDSPNIICEKFYGAGSPDGFCYWGQQKEAAHEVSE